MIGYQHSKHILGVHGFVSLTVTSKNANISTFISLLAKVIYFCFRIGRSYIQFKVHCPLEQWFDWSVYREKTKSHLFSDFQRLNDQLSNTKSKQGSITHLKDGWKTPSGLTGTWTETKDLMFKESTSKTFINCLWKNR